MNTLHLNLPPATVPAPPVDRPSLQKVPRVVLLYRLRLLLPGTLHHYLCGYASTIPSDKQHYNTIAAFIRSNNTWALPLELLVQQTNISDGAFPRSPTHDFMISLTGLYVGQRALPTFRVGPNDMKALGAAFKCSAFLNKYSPGAHAADKIEPTEKISLEAFLPAPDSAATDAVAPPDDLFASVTSFTADINNVLANIPSPMAPPPGLPTSLAPYFALDGDAREAALSALELPELVKLAADKTLSPLNLPRSPKKGKDTPDEDYQQRLAHFVSTTLMGAVETNDAKLRADYDAHVQAIRDAVTAASELASGYQQHLPDHINESQATIAQYGRDVATAAATAAKPTVSSPSEPYERLAKLKHNPDFRDGDFLSLLADYQQAWQNIAAQGPATTSVEHTASPNILTDAAKEILYKLFTTDRQLIVDYCTVMNLDPLELLEAAHPVILGTKADGIELCLQFRMIGRLAVLTDINRHSRYDAQLNNSFVLNPMRHISLPHNTTPNFGARRVLLALREALELSDICNIKPSPLEWATSVFGVGSALEDPNTWNNCSAITSQFRTLYEQFNNIDTNHGLTDSLPDDWIMLFLAELIKVSASLELKHPDPFAPSSNPALFSFTRDNHDRLPDGARRGGGGGGGAPQLAIVSRACPLQPGHP